VPAIPQGVTSLRSGELSVTFHIPFESAETAFEIHKMQKKLCRIDIYLEEE
jgi:hypothetical protein